MGWFLLSFSFLTLLWGKKEYKYDLAICSVFQNEAPYLKEWIEFHKLIGVQRFYLYNNLSEDNFEEVLAPYIKSGIVELIDWPYSMQPGDKFWMGIQTKAHTNGLKRAKADKVRWIAFIDLDEFLFPIESMALIDTLSEYEQKGVGGVAVNWQMYGSSYLKTLPKDKLMIEALKRKAPEFYIENNQVKTIARTKYAVACKNPHRMLYVKGYFFVNENREVVNNSRTKAISVNRLRINHYWTRHEDYFYKNKIERRRQKVHLGEEIQELIDRFNHCNETVEKDSPIFKYVPALREQMGLS